MTFNIKKVPGLALIGLMTASLALGYCKKKDDDDMTLLALLALGLVACRGGRGRSERKKKDRQEGKDDRRRSVCASWNIARFQFPGNGGHGGSSLVLPPRSSCRISFALACRRSRLRRGCFSLPLRATGDAKEGARTCVPNDACSGAARLNPAAQKPAGWGSARPRTR